MQILYRSDTCNFHSSFSIILFFKINLISFNRRLSYLYSPHLLYSDFSDSRHTTLFGLPIVSTTSTWCRMGLFSNLERLLLLPARRCFNLSKYYYTTTFFKHFCSFIFSHHCKRATHNISILILHMRFPSFSAALIDILLHRGSIYLI